MKRTYMILLVLLLSGCANMCNECDMYEYEPAKIIYRETIYTPKTYKYVTYERKPYNRCEQEKFCR